MIYEIGDKVYVKSIDWYNANKDIYGNVNVSKSFFIPSMKKYCGKMLTITEVLDSHYKVAEDGGEFYWTDDMFEKPESSMQSIPGGIKNKELQELLNQYPDDAVVVVEYCNVKELSYNRDKNMITID